MVYFQKLDGTYSFNYPWAYFRICSNLKKKNQISLTGNGSNEVYSLTIRENSSSLPVCLATTLPGYVRSRTDISQGPALIKRFYYDLVLKLN